MDILKERSFRGASTPTAFLAAFSPTLRCRIECGWPAALPLGAAAAERAGRRLVGPPATQGAGSFSLSRGGKGSRSCGGRPGGQWPSPRRLHARRSRHLLSLAAGRPTAAARRRARRAPSGRANNRHAAEGAPCGPRWRCATRPMCTARCDRPTSRGRTGAAPASQPARREERRGQSKKGNVCLLKLFVDTSHVSHGRGYHSTPRFFARVNATGADTIAHAHQVPVLPSDAGQGACVQSLQLA